MPAPATGPEAPAWTSGATARAAFRRGLIEAPSTPVLVVVGTFVGFGALARDVGLDLAQAMFVTATVFALPGQVVLADQVAQGAGLAAAAFAVTLTAVRLLPLTVSMLPHLRARRARRGLEFFLAHFIAITVWIEATRRLPRLPAALRVPYYLGFVTVLFAGTLAATVLGFSIAGQVPEAVAAGLVFLTPIYFFLSLIQAAADSAEAAAVAIGSVLGPVLFVFVPGPDLFLTGLIGGTIAYGAFRWRVRAK